MNKHDWILGTLAVNLLCIPLGCGSARIGPQAGAADRVRQMNTLKAENEVLRLKVRELEEIKTSSEIPGAQLQDGLPMPVNMTLATGSVVRIGENSVAEVRLKTTDSRGHFIQVTGPVRILLVSIDEEGLPIGLADHEVANLPLREMLREGFMGSAYAVDIPIEGTPEIGDSVMVRATMHDTRLSEPLETEAMMPVLEGRKGQSGQ
jgi:hypothetical protein